MWLLFFFQAEDGIRDLVRSRGLGDVYKRQIEPGSPVTRSDMSCSPAELKRKSDEFLSKWHACKSHPCLLYTSDAADERSSVDLGGRRIIKKKKKKHRRRRQNTTLKTSKQADETSHNRDERQRPSVSTPTKSKK